MGTYPQRLTKTRKEIAAEGVVAGYGERKADFHGLGRRVGNRYAPFRPVVCVQACRTPYGAFGGSLKAFSAPELGALAIQEVLRRAAGQIVPEEVDYVLMGQVVTAGSGQHPARQAAMLGGLPASVPSVTLNKVCASAMKTLDLGAQMIQLKRAEIVIAGGQESMSSAPYLLPDMRWGARMGVPTGRVLDAMVFDGLWDAFHERHMALHGSEAADEFGIGRQDQDEWACRSQQAAHLARSQGRLDEEIFPILVQRNKEQVVFDRDEGLRPSSTPEVLAGLPSVFNHVSAVTGRSGSVTAGNAPGVSDGADVCLLMSGEMADQRSVTPLFTLLDYAEVSSAPRDIAVVPGLAIRKILEQNDLSLEQVDLVEINEAFAAVVLVSAGAVLGMSREEMERKINVNGSAIAYGHPIGASGARLVMTLAYELRRRGGGLGICSLCSGLGQGDAMLISVSGKGT